MFLLLVDINKMNKSKSKISICPNRRSHLNKRGAEKILAVYWFVVLIIVAGGIFAMVYVFYHGSYDVRDIEANIMINKIADCLSEGGYLREEVFNVTNETFLLNKSNFLEVCHLNFNVEEKWDKEQYYVEINIYKFGEVNKLIFEISEGNKNWKGFCELQDDKEYERLVKCVKKRFYSLDKEENDEERNQYLIEILSIIRKTEKNVK